jgi:hypothetical protein
VCVCVCVRMAASVFYKASTTDFVVFLISSSFMQKQQRSPQYTLHKSSCYERE